MNNPENGLKILARMIAEAYLEELSKKPNQALLPDEREHLEDSLKSDPTVATERL